MLRANTKNEMSIIDVRLAGKNIRINLSVNWDYSFFDSYFYKFDKPDIELYIDEHEILSSYLQDKTFQHLIKAHEEHHIAISYNLANQIPISILGKVADALLDYNILLMHGVVISNDNIGIMITAPSGIGKTTRARIWLEEYPHSFIVNGDKPFVRIDQSGVYAYGSPWCGQEGYNINTVVPLDTVYYLERSTTNAIHRLNSSESFLCLLQQTYRNPDIDKMKKTVALLKRLSMGVNIYKFYSTPSIEAIHLAYDNVYKR